MNQLAVFYDCFGGLHVNTCSVRAQESDITLRAMRGFSGLSLTVMVSLYSATRSLSSRLFTCTTPVWQTQRGRDKPSHITSVNPHTATVFSSVFSLTVFVYAVIYSCHEFTNVFAGNICWSVFIFVSRRRYLQDCRWKGAATPAPSHVKLAAGMWDQIWEKPATRLTLAHALLYVPPAPPSPH